MVNLNHVKNAKDNQLLIKVPTISIRQVADYFASFARETTSALITNRPNYKQLVNAITLNFLQNLRAGVEIASELPRHQIP